MSTAVTTAGRVFFARSGRSVEQWASVDPGAASVLWEALAEPVCGGELPARVGMEPSAVGALMDLLLENQVVIPWTLVEFEPGGPLPAVHARPSCQRLVWGISGAVQAVFAPSIVGRLAGKFAERLDVVLTRSARKFVRPKALSVLGATVWHDPFDLPGPGRVPHMELASQAELMLVYPATADTIFRLAHGACSDLLSLVVSATEVPVVVVPSMNPAMWRHPPTRRNVQMLRDDGVFVVEPGPARSAACGVDHETGGPGLGPDSANLIGTLTAVLRLNRSRGP